MFFISGWVGEQVGNKHLEGKILHLHSLIWKIGNLLYIYAGQFGNSGSTDRVGNLAVLKPLTDKAHRGLLLSQNHSEPCFGPSAGAERFACFTWVA